MQGLRSAPTKLADRVGGVSGAAK